MKVFTGFVVAASAISNRVGDPPNSWPANDHAPHCGCNAVVDPEQYGGWINKTCTITFPYASEDPHFVSVASSYMLGRDRQAGPDGFKFTGFDEVSNPDVLDILVFYEEIDCPRDDNETAKYCDYDLKCEDERPEPGVYLGNFNYDIARSVQTYTVPVYGLEQGMTANFNIFDYYGEPANCMNAESHHGHGFVDERSSCSDNTTCGNTIIYKQNEEHNGLLEYFQFEPVSPTNNPYCWALPLHHVDDYKWLTPSPWDTQEEFVQPERNE